jgi:hypothetical protein
MRLTRGWVVSMLVVLLVQTGAFAQSLSSPTRTQCKQWDDAYLSTFQTGLVVCAVATLVLALLVGLLGRWSWIAAAPRLRIVMVALLVGLVVEVGIVATPWMVGFGWLWFSAVDTAYFNCIPMRFGAQGILKGLIGPDVAAVAQWPTLIYLLLSAAATAGLAAWLISEFVARSFGLRQRARREGA